MSAVLDGFSRDVRLAMRSLIRNKTFAATAILSIGLGIGANTAIFSLIHAVMLRPLPARAPHELVELRNVYPDPAEPKMNGFSWQFHEQLRERRDLFAELAGVGLQPAKVSSPGFEAEPVDALLVTDQFFPMLGTQPALGRLIGPGDSHPALPATSVGVLSWAYWQRRFAGDAAVIGKTIQVNTTPVIVVGVGPRALTGISPGLRTDIWLPVVGQPGVAVIGRLRTGVTYEQVEAGLTELNRQRVEAMFAQSRDPLWRRARLEVSSAAGGISALRDRYGRALTVLMAIVALLLAIACTNIAAILLARGAARQQEIAVRLALGAGRLRIVRQVLTESLLIASIGSVAGLAIAYFAANGLIQMLMSGAARLPMTFDLRVPLDFPLLVFTTGVAVVTGLIFGLAPARQALSFVPVSTAQQIRSRNDSRAHRVFGRAVIVVQVALSALLLGSAAVFAGHLSNLRHQGLGFDRNSVLLVSASISENQNRETALGRYREALARLAAIPGVRSASLSAVTPIEGGAASRFIRVEGVDEPADARRFVMLNWVGPNYFETFGTARIAGRDFEFSDQGRPPVAIVNQSLARHYFGESNPIGRHFTIDKDTHRYEIVGIVADAKYSDLHQPAPQTIYLHYFQSGPLPQQWALRTSVPPLAAATQAEQVLRDAAPGIRVGTVTTLAAQMDKSLGTERVVAMLAALFGVVGSALVAVGLFGLLAFTVTRRTREIGIRLALGATRAGVARMILLGALRPVALGLAIGVPLALGGQRVAASLVDGLSATDRQPVAIAAFSTLVIALIAGYLPARQAAGIRPGQALRHD